MIQGVQQIISNMCNIMCFNITLESTQTIEFLLTNVFLKSIVVTSYKLFDKSSNQTQINTKTLVNSLRLLFKDTLLVSLLNTGQQAIVKDKSKTNTDHDISEQMGRIDYNQVRVACSSLINFRVSKSYVIFATSLLEYMCREFVYISLMESYIRNNTNFVVIEKNDIFAAIKKDFDIKIFFDMQLIKILDQPLVFPKRQIMKNIRDYISSTEATNIKISNKTLHLLQKYIEHRILEELTTNKS